MLSNPNVLDLIPKIGNRYEVVMAVSKRARDIANQRIEEEDKSIEDPVDIAAKEFDEGTVVLDEKNNFNTHDYIDSEEMEVQAGKDEEEIIEEEKIEKKKTVRKKTSETTKSSKTKKDSKKSEE